MSRARVLVVGVGERVREAFLPALARCAQDYELAGFRSKRAHPFEAAGAEHQTAPLSELRPADLAGVDLVYLAVPKPAVPEALARLAACEPGRATLLVETPVLLFKHLARLPLLEAFGDVQVAEDCCALPWIEAVLAPAVQGLCGPLRELCFERSAYRYHAHALAKTLLGGARLAAARRRRTPGGARVELRFRSGARATVVEPRDYAAGWFELHGESGVISDRAERASPGLFVEPVVTDGRCAAVRVGPHEVALDAAERDLAGPFEAGDTITARTEAWKRVGLLRLLRRVRAGRGAWPLDEALDDMGVDYLLEKLGRWRPTPLSDLSAPAVRRRLGRLLRLAGRG